MINNFEFAMRTQIIFENGCVNRTGEVTAGFGCKKIMLVADKGVRSTGIVGKVADSLKAAGIDVLDFDKIVPNPRIVDCEAGAKLGLQEKVDGVVAVGGGSSIDSAKVISGLLGHETSDFKVIGYPNAYTKKALPTIAIPTTAGTGSEVTPFAVVTDLEKKFKDFTWDLKCAPDVALCDPEVLMELPSLIAASTGMDALTHAIEGYLAKCTSPITEAFGLSAVKYLADHLRDYIFNRDINSCEGVMLGSLIAGLSFGYSDTAAVHSISETIGGEFDTPHGITNAIFLADVCECSIPAAVEKYAKIAEAMGVNSSSLSRYETAQAGVQEIRNLVNDFQIPNLREFDKVNPAEFPRIAQKCTEHMSLPDNPRLLDADDFLMLLNKAYDRT